MIALAALLAIQATDPSGAFDAFFADFAKKRDAIQVLEARYTQKNTSPEETVDSAGAIVYVKPRRILFRYERPDAGTTYLIDGRKAYEYEPDIKQLQIYDLQDNPETEVFFLGFQDNTEALRKAYEVTVFQSDGKAADSKGIIIRPKESPGDTQNFREVKLYLRDADYLPYRIHITHENDSEVDIAITDFTINAKLDPQKARIALPGGTKIIDNDELVETVGAAGKSVPEKDVILVEPLAQPANKETPAR